jgi:hypothetical protein
MLACLIDEVEQNSALTCEPDAAVGQ